jgi:hypothetical protein
VQQSSFCINVCVRFVLLVFVFSIRAPAGVFPGAAFFLYAASHSFTPPHVFLRHIAASGRYFTSAFEPASPFCVRMFYPTRVHLKFPFCVWSFPSLNSASRTSRPRSTRRETATVQRARLTEQSRIDDEGMVGRKNCFGEDKAQPSLAAGGKKKPSLAGRHHAAAHLPSLPLSSLTESP